MNVFSLALSSLKKHSYDVILLDMTRGETDMADFRSLKSLLKPGGVLSVSAGTLKYSSDPHHENWKLYRHINNLFRHTHPYTQHRPCTDSLHFYLMAFDSDTLPNPSSLHPSYVDKWVDRRTTHVPVHYDSETHMSFFNGMPSWIRRAIKSIDATIPEHSSSASSASTANAVGRQVMLPYYEGKPVQTSFVKGNFFNREFYGCEREALSQVDTLERAMIKALEYAHAKNTSTIFHYIQHDLVNMTFSQSPTRGSSSSAAETTTTSHDYPHMIQLSVFFEGGQISVKTFPHLGYAHILVDNRNEYYDFDEAVNHLALHLERVESVGYDRTFGARSSEYPDMTSMEWEVKTFESSKFVVKKSDTAGLGQYAIRMIKKGELVFFNRIDTQLRAEEELFPKGRPWQNEWQQNMVEEVFDGKYTAPRLSDSFDDVTLYTNHNCDPNLWYEGTYDSMVARRDIRIGEELTYDYATVDTDTSFKCNCGSKMCRKNVTGSDWMMKGLQDRYGLEHFFPNVRRLIVEDRRKHEHLHHHNH